MKYEKYLSILYVAVFLITFFSASFAGNITDGIKDLVKTQNMVKGSKKIKNSDKVVQTLLKKGYDKDKIQRALVLAEQSKRYNGHQLLGFIATYAKDKEEQEIAMLFLIAEENPDAVNNIPLHNEYDEEKEKERVSRILKILIDSEQRYSLAYNGKYTNDFNELDISIEGNYPQKNIVQMEKFVFTLETPLIEVSKKDSAKDNFTYNLDTEEIICQGNICKELNIQKYFPRAKITESNSSKQEEKEEKPLGLTSSTKVKQTEKNPLDDVLISTITKLSSKDKEQLEQVKALVEKGASVNAKNSTGKTALYLAVQKHKKELVEYLISQGAIVGQEEIDMAKRNDEIKHILLHHQ